MKIYTIKRYPYPSGNIDYYSTREKARIALAKLAVDRIYNPGVRHYGQGSDFFWFIFGWEEHKIEFKIEEIDTK